MSADLKEPNNDYNQDYDQEDESEDQKPEFDNDNDNENQEDYDGDDQQQQIGEVSGEGPKYVRLRGLPWSATHQEILDFLKSIHVINGSKGIHLVTSRWDGKNTGEAFVEVQSQTDVDEAHKLNKGLMGHRYIEVFDANAKEAQQAMKKTGGPGTSYVVKLRGLPYAVTEQQVEEFFNGLEIKPDREGILFVMDRRGRATGEAYVQFESQEDTEQALGRNREKIGHRYIEIFRSSLAELKRSSNGNGRPGPYDLKERGGNRGGDFGGNGGGGRNNMRGGGDWNSGGFGVGANNTLGFSSLGNFNSGNFGNGGGGGFGGNNGGGFGGGNNAGNFGNGGGGFGGNNNRFNGPNNGGGGNGSGGNFSSDFGDFGNFGNNRNNNFNNGSNDFADDNSFSGRGNSGGNFGTGGNFGNLGNFGNFGNSGLAAVVGVGGGGSGSVGGGSGGNMGNFNTNMGVNNAGGGGNFGPIGGGRNDSEYFSVHMRGLPYSSYENDIFKFFDPIRPANVRINFNKKGLHSGTSDVFFDTYEDAQLAMKRHKEQMGNRYIELFFDGKTKGGNPSGGGGGGNNNMGNNFSRRI